MADSFTPQQIEQFLQQFFDVVGARQYIGARYVPIFGRADSDTVEWDDLAPYEPLTVVMHDGVSYVSRRYVPAGIDVTDTAYWAETYRFNAQVEQYRQQVLSFQGQIDGLRDDMEADYVPFPNAVLFPKYGTSGQVLSTLADGTTKWEDPVVPSDEQAEEVITSWLDDHPEATTTVQDGAITTAKLADNAVTEQKLSRTARGSVADLEGYAANFGSFVVSNVEQGSLTGSTGEEVASSYYVRTGFIANAKTVSMASSAHKITMFCYDAAKVKVRGTGSLSTPYTFDMDSIRTSHPTEKWFRFVISNVDNSNITPETAEHPTVIFNKFATKNEIPSLVPVYEQMDEYHIDATMYERKDVALKSSDFSNVGGIDATNGSFTGNTTYRRTDVMPLYKYDAILARIYSSSTLAGFAVYSDAAHTTPLLLVNNMRTATPYYYEAKQDCYVVFSTVQDQLTDMSVMMHRRGQVPDMVWQNLDRQSMIEQVALSRSDYFTSTYKIANFLHFSDVHRSTYNWDRLCDYLDYYEDSIPFALHTGDYVGSNVTSYDRHYQRYTPRSVPILNCVGNHDTYAAGGTAGTAGKQTTYDILFGDVDTTQWGVTFGAAQYAMYYYKDIEDTGIRLIVLDQYYWDSTEQAWLASVLADALTNSRHVITAMHTATGQLTTIGSGFFSLEAWGDPIETADNVTPIVSAIQTFMGNGGTHIVHLCGHWHHDEIGTDANGLLNVVIETASGVAPTSDALTTTNDDSARVPFMRCWDSANVMSIDRNLGLLKIYRVGCNASSRLQGRNVLCYDYVNRQIVATY